MGRIYDFYEQRVFPHVIEFAMRPMEELRDTALAEAHGRVLELGFGTGLNLRHYPDAVTALATADPMPLREKTRERVAASRFPVEVNQLRADGELPYEAEAFDCVTVTWTLCTIPDPVRALEEARRVLRPGGRLLFIEHGRSDDPGVARWQDRWNPVQNVIGCGCNVNRKIDAIVEQAGFGLERLDRFCMEGAPRMFGETYRGAAVAKA